VNAVMNLRVPYMPGISCLAANLLAFQERLVNGVSYYRPTVTLSQTYTTHFNPATNQNKGNLFQQLL
jgi:hypothetical protein